MLAHHAIAILHDGRALMALALAVLQHIGA